MIRFAYCLCTSKTNTYVAAHSHVIETTSVAHGIGFRPTVAINNYHVRISDQKE